MNRPLVVDIKRHSLEDGPGIRSVVFFKGCLLRCSFCQNPETQDRALEVSFSSQRCLLCGRCVATCPNAAIDLEAASRIRRERCRRCGLCAQGCPASALRAIGAGYTAEALAEVLIRDLDYYQRSGGGVTLSGGEPLLHIGFVAEVLGLVKERGIHVALETCGDFDYAAFRDRVLPLVDLVYFDVKFADPDEHRLHTGRSNHRIVANLRRLLGEGTVEVIPTIPLVPEVTATRANLEAIAELLIDVGATEVRTLPYNPLFLDSAESLGRERPKLRATFMKPEELEQAYAILERKLRSADTRK